MMKLNWMLEQLEADSFCTNTEEVRAILEGRDLESADPALVDYVLELDSEWNNTN